MRAVGLWHPPSLVRHLSTGSEMLGHGSRSGFFAIQLVSLVDSLGAALNPRNGDFASTQFPSTNQASSSEPGSGLQAGKSGVPRIPLPCPFPAATLALGCLISAEAPSLKTHFRHPVAEHSTKTGEIKSIRMSSCAGGEYLTLLFINNSLALTCLNKSSNKVKCRSQRLTNMKMCILTGSPPGPAGSPNLSG